MRKSNWIIFPRSGWKIHFFLKFNHLALNNGDEQPSPMSYQSATHLNWFFRDQISQEWCPPENDAIPLRRFQISVVKNATLPIRRGLKNSRFYCKYTWHTSPPVTTSISEPPIRMGINLSTKVSLQQVWPTMTNQKNHQVSPQLRWTFQPLAGPRNCFGFIAWSIGGGGASWTYKQNLHKYCKISTGNNIHMIYM